MTVEEERIALFLDYENLAIGAREKLNGLAFDFKPLAEALAERGRVVVRRAYADWSYFGADRRMLTRHHVELIEIPQRMGVRKNAADIKMAVDAMELCFERAYLTTFVIGTGDSDFTPLVHKLRELNKRVIGVGVKASTSELLPPACDEFLFYEALEGFEEPERPKRRAARPTKREQPSTVVERPVEVVAKVADVDDLATLVSQTLAGMGRGTGDVALASSLKRALLRKDPTFNEADYGFRTFGELIRFLESRKVIEFGKSGATSDPEIGLPERGGTGDDALALLRTVVAELEAKGAPALMSGLKNQLRKHQPAFSEKKLGYTGFLQFCKAGRARGVIDMELDEAADDYVVRPGATPGD